MDDVLDRVAGWVREHRASGRPVPIQYGERTPIGEIEWLFTLSFEKTPRPPPPMCRCTLDGEGAIAKAAGIVTIDDMRRLLE